MDKNGVTYINKAFYEEGSLKGFAKIEQNDELILGVFENGKLNGPVYRKNNDKNLEQIAVFRQGKEEGYGIRKIGNLADIGKFKEGLLVDGF